MAETFKRQVAVKLDIQNLLDLAKNRTAEELVAQGIGRVNLIGTIVEREEGSLLMEDGTGQVTLRSFDRPELIADAPLGVPVIVVGRPRTYNSECYLIPEIIQIVKDRRWIEVRKRELAMQPLRIPQQGSAPMPEIEIIGEDFQKSTPSAEQLLETIRRLDQGEGAPIEDVVRELPNTETAIEHLLLRGEIFQLRPGIVKVLN